MNLTDNSVNMRRHSSALLKTGVVLLALAPIGSAQSWSSSGPAPRYLASAVFDPGTSRMMIFGGILNAGTNAAQNGIFDDVWRLNNVGAANLNWVRVRPTGKPPAPRQGHSAVFDAGSNRMVVFGGGLGFSSPCTNDTWALTNANGQGGTPAWLRLSPAGALPHTRLAFVAAYNTAANTMIVFGGNDCFSTDFGDVWTLSNANGVTGTPAWTMLTPSGPAPAARAGGSGVYDSANNRLIIFGGESGAGQLLNDVWVLSNADGSGGAPVWTEIVPSGALPAPRNATSAVYDAANNRMTIFGGGDAAGLLGDTWVLSNANGLGGSAAWTELGPFGVFAEARAYHNSVYDPSKNAMVVFGGNTATNPVADTNDVWVLSQANGL
jgi:Galactose oxidase, central domain